MRQQKMLLWLDGILGLAMNGKSDANVSKFLEDQLIAQSGYLTKVNNGQQLTIE